MHNKVTDQADGLRRLMASKTGKQVALIDCESGAGPTCLARNLAAALKHQGQDILPLSERAGRPLIPPMPALPANPATGGAHLVLIDAALDADGALSPSAARSDHVLVAFEASAASLTQAYLCVKRLHYAHALQRMRVLVYGAADADEAKRLLANLASTASRYLAVALEPAGWVRADPLLAQARRLDLSIVEAFQASPAARDFRQIAASLLQWPCPVAAERVPSFPAGHGARGEPQHAH